MLRSYSYPWGLEEEIDTLVEHYNDWRYPESLEDLTPAGNCYGKQNEALAKREGIMQN